MEVKLGPAADPQWTRAVKIENPRAENSIESATRSGPAQWRRTRKLKMEVKLGRAADPRGGD